MDLRTLIAGTWLVLVPIAVSAGHPVFSFYTFLAPPYQNSAPRTPLVSGETTETIRCALRQAGHEAFISLMPQSRARYSLERNLVDGYFAVGPTKTLDENAIRTNPVALEKWHWFFTAEQPPNPQNAKVGVVSGSNENIWLEEHGITPFITVAGAEQLPALLARKRIDLALMDGRAMEYLQNISSNHRAELSSEFVRYAPLYLYVNPNLANSHPQFVSTFNDHLANCPTPSLKLTEPERLQVRQITQTLLRDLSPAVNLGNALSQGPAYDNLTDILNKDVLWQALAPHLPTPLAREILALPASEALAHWQAAHAPMVTEVFLTDRSGALVAMSRLSSDYWQGDERKFQEIAGEPELGVERKKDIWISPIRYDASTARFQVTVSFPVPLSEPSNQLEGVLIFGLDIEHVLHGRSPLPR
ncbi:transporter substrate-binding domain-containing protein [Marinobacter daepoensis]|uniref:transporter substrate-binding domain-containing protein n=1 Tax=Marinobacter daepoensis TaxID=262077 RepID=UPI0003FE22E9|nr:hypothetical protein [Marinobacter daepoensis]